MTRADGSMREHNGLAVVLRGELLAEAQIDLIEKLTSAAPEVDIGGWLFTPHAVSSPVSKLGILIYRSSVAAI